MSETSITLVATGTPDPDGMNEMKQYIGAAGPIFTSHGGEIVYRGKIAKALAGNVTFAMILIVKFESEAALETTLGSTEYQKIIPLREKGFKHMDFLVSHPM